MYLLTEQGTKTVLSAKGVRKATSRKAHAVDLLNTVEVKYSQLGEIGIISEIKLIDQHRQFKQNLQGLLFVESVCELLSIFVQEEVHEPGYFRNLENLLSITQPKRYKLLFAALLLRFLVISGNIPALDIDVVTEDKLDLDKAYRSSGPGYTNNQEESSKEQVSSRLIKSQLFILQSAFAAIDQLALSNEEQLELLQLHVSWLNTSTHTELRSLPMLIESA